MILQQLWSKEKADLLATKQRTEDVAANVVRVWEGMFVFLGILPVSKNHHEWSKIQQLICVHSDKQAFIPDQRRIIRGVRCGMVSHTTWHAEAEACAAQVRPQPPRHIPVHQGTRARKYCQVRPSLRAVLREYSEYPFHGRYDRAASILSVVTVPSLKQTSSSAKLVYEVPAGAAVREYSEYPLAFA
jgi:hypothetical protein